MVLKEIQVRLKVRNLWCLILFCVASGSHAVLFHGNYPRDHYCDVYHSHDFSTEYCYYPGSGPLVVLMPDLGSNMGSWTSNFLQAINNFSSLLIYNRPQYGDSEDLTVGNTRWVAVDRIALQLDELLAHLKSNKKKLVLAYGAGAYYAQYFASQKPGWVDGMVLVNPMGLDQPCEDYKLYHKHIPAQRSLGYREFLGLQRQERQAVQPKRRKLLMPTVLVSNPSMLKSNRNKARWQKRQAHIQKQFKTAKHITMSDRIDEHSGALRQAKLIDVLHQMVQQLAS
jgi:pimeloyl-ACP methyl ester carboxylesterase